MASFLTAPDTDPNVSPTKPTQASGFWGAVGGFLAAVYETLPFLPPIPEPYGKWVIVGGVFLGAILNRVFNRSYRATK